MTYPRHKSTIARLVRVYRWLLLRRSDVNRQERLSAISNHVKGRKARERQSDGETWIDHLCLFHEDVHERSATWQEQTGVYHCWAEDRTYSVEDVERVIGLPGLAGPAAANPRPQEPGGPVAPSPELVSEVDYTYTYPDGRLSHTHVRRDYSDGSKQMPFRAPDGSWTEPKQRWPFYDEQPLDKGLYLILVEGEKKVDMVNAMQDDHDSIAIRAITVGSSANTKKLASTIGQRFIDLAPAAVILWPDNDSPGIDCMKAVRKELDRLHVPNVTVDPLRYSLGPAQDVADYIYDGGSLAKVVSDHLTPITIQSNGANLSVQRMLDLVQNTTVISPGTFVYAGTQTPAKIDNPQLEALWFSTYNVAPASSAIRELRAKLINKGMVSPTDIAFRTLAFENGFWWRPNADQPCYQVTAEEIVRVQDPPETMILVPRASPRFSSQVDLEGDYQDFYRFCQAFSLDHTSEGLVLSWLVSAFTGRKTPILLLKGGAATGKTTLATYLCALVDPDVPTLSAQKVERDLREFVRTAQRHPALLLDNVGTVKPDIEDALSKLVTGEAAPLRVLYEDVIETIHLQRAIAVTTTTWDVTKGDLASRMWPIEPKLPEAGYLDDEEVEAQFDSLVPRLRGFAMKMCQTYYRRREEFTTSSTKLRIGGRVLQTMGYDANATAEYVRASRARVIAEGEPWLDALVDLWEEIKVAGPYHWEPTELCAYLRKMTSEEPSAKALSNFIRPRQALFPNYGFQIQWGRNSSRRFYQFSKAKE